MVESRADRVDRISIEYAGTMQPLFWLVLNTTILTVMTLGIYRFWMKTRLRRYYWSSIRPDDTPLEYTGTGLEKLLPSGARQTHIPRNRLYVVQRFESRF